MMSGTGRPLLISYGGGHANIMVALADELSRRGVEFDLLGLTTAHATFKRAGLAPIDITALLNLPDDQWALDAVQPFLPKTGHKDISESQTHAYFALGFADLAKNKGIEKAKDFLASHGRKAFEPTGVFERFLAEREASVLVATTSPRFELAAIRAANRLAIPSIAIGDHFLIGETEYIASGDYAEHLVVFSQAVADRLASKGPEQTCFHVLGNPAFDLLSAKPGDEERRTGLRAQLGLTDKKVLFWPLGGDARSGSGQELLDVTAVEALLAPLCGSSSQWRFVLRPHPNWPVERAELAGGMFVPADFSAEDCLLISDLVVVESSTMGLQAVLKGIPTINYRHAEFTVYPQLGWASQANDAAELGQLIENETYLQPPADVTALVGSATKKTADLVIRLHREHVLQQAEAARSD